MIRSTRPCSSSLRLPRQPPGDAERLNLPAPVPQQEEEAGPGQCAQDEAGGLGSVRLLDGDHVALDLRPEARADQIRERAPPRIAEPLREEITSRLPGDAVEREVGQVEVLG